MPVLRDDQEKRTGRRGWRWLWLLALPPLMFAGLLLLPLARPVTIEIGGYCFYVQAVQHRAAFAGGRPFGVFTRRVPFPIIELDGPGKWVVTDGVYSTSSWIGRWGYRVVWWRGRRVAVPYQAHPRQPTRKTTG